MVSRPPDILYVTDDQGPRRALMDVFNGAGLLISIADSREDVMSMLADQSLDAILFHADEAGTLLENEQQSRQLTQQLTMLYEIMLLVTRNDLTVPELLALVPPLVEQAFIEPDAVCCQITFMGEQMPAQVHRSGHRSIHSLRCNQRQVGEIALIHRTTTYEFTAQEERLLTMVASILNHRITQATLRKEIAQQQPADVRELQRQNEQLQMLRNIDRVILSRRSTSEIAEVTIRELQRVVEFRRASLTLFDFAMGEALAIATDDPATQGMRVPIQRIPSLLDKLQTNQPHIESDLYALDNPSPAEQVWIQRGIRSYVMFPLVVDGEVFGSLNLGRLQPGSLSAADIALVQEVTGQLAVALRHVRQHEAVAQQVEELITQQDTLTRQIDASTSELYATNERLEREISVRKNAEAAEHQQRILAESLRDIATALNSSLDFNDVLDQVLASIGRVLPFDAINIMLVEEDDMARVSRARGYEEHMLDAINQQEAFPIAQRDYLHIMYSTHMPLIISNTQNSEFWSERPAQNWIRSYIGAPIMADGIVMGFINVKSVAPDYYQDSHLERLKMFTDQAAIAFRNARDHEKAIQYAMLEDRQRLARDLHDAVSQTLFSATVVAGTTLRGWARSPESVQPQLEQLNRLIRGALAEMRTLLLELRPTALQDTGLNELVRQLSEAYSGRNRGTIGVEISGDAELPPKVKIEIYRILQEALNNVSKHARAARVRVALTYTTRHVTISIEDDGRGFNPAQVDPGALGLSIMQERARHIGATLVIDSQPDQGTRITLTWTRIQDRESA